MLARAIGVAAICAVMLTACVQNVAAPARTDDGYQAAVSKTAGAAGSAVATAKLQADAAVGGQAFFPYLSVAISDTEDELASVAATFASIQPPPGPPADLRTRVVDLLNRSQADVSAARISIRNGTSDGLDATSAALAHDADAWAQLGGT